MESVIRRLSFLHCILLIVFFARNFSTYLEVAKEVGQGIEALENASDVSGLLFEALENAIDVNGLLIKILHNVVAVDGQSIEALLQTCDTLIDSCVRRVLFDWVNNWIDFYGYHVLFVVQFMLGRF